MKKIIVTLFLITAFAPLTLAQQKPANEGLFWIRENGKFGYINSTGKVVIKPQYETTMGFNEGLAATKLGGKFGFINTKGEWIIKPQFDFSYVFMEGLAMVKTNGKHAWIDRKGQIVIPAQDFEEVATGFSEGRLAVKKGGKWGYIDKTGKIVIEPRFEEANKFEGGAAQVVTENHQHHWIDRNGKILWSQQIDVKTQK
ncbi:MAG: WG repeat-containing protein [Pyrinomonadaceae bacterium]|nr:WG repeat-containing protein [Pyrinomonadaceae bacterium]